MDEVLIKQVLPMFQEQGLIGLMMLAYLYRENKAMKFQREQTELKKEITQEFTDVLRELKNELSSKGCKNYEI